MDKTQQFILLVQTGLIVRYCATGSLVGQAGGEIKAGWAVDRLAEAFEIIPRIPTGVTPQQAARDFLTNCFCDQDDRKNLSKWLFN